MEYKVFNYAPTANRWLLIAGLERLVYAWFLPLAVSFRVGSRDSQIDHDYNITGATASLTSSP